MGLVSAMMMCECGGLVVRIWNWFKLLDAALAVLPLAMFKNSQIWVRGRPEHMIGRHPPRPAPPASQLPEHPLHATGKPDRPKMLANGNPLLPSG